MKTLVIYPTSGLDRAFYLLDPETGEGLAQHFCSCSSYAKGDLLDNRPERKKAFKEKYNQEVEAKFINETDYKWEDILKKNKALQKKYKNTV